MIRCALAVLAALSLAAAPCLADDGPKPERRIPLGADGRIWALAASKDGRRLAELDEKGRLWILSVPDGNVLASSSTALQYIDQADLFFSADGSKLGLNYRYGGNPRAALFDGRTAKGLKLALPAGVEPAALNSGLTAVAAWEGVFDLATGKKLTDVRAQALSPDGRLAASMKSTFERPNWVRTVTVQELPGGAEVWHRDSQSENVLVGLVFSSDGKTLAELFSDRRAVFVDARTGSELGSTGRGSFVGLPRYSPDGSSFAMSDASEDLELFSAPATPRLKLKLEGGFNNHTMEAAAFSPDGSSLYAGDSTGIGRFSVSDGAQNGGVGPVGTIQALALSPDGKTLAALFYGSGIVLLDVSSGRILHLLPTQLFASALAFSPDGARVAAGEQNGPLKVFDTKGKLVYTLAANSAQSAAFSPDGKKLLVCSASGAQVYNMETGDLIESFDGGGWLNAWTPDAKHVAIAALNKVVLWNPVTGVMVRDYTGLPDSVGLRSLAISPDGKLVAAGDDHGGVTFWELGSAKLLRTVKAGDNEVETLRFMGGGRKLLAMSGNYSAGRRAALFDAATGETLPFPAPAERKAGCAVLGAGERTLLTCENRAVDVWRLAPEPAKPARAASAEASKRKRASQRPHKRKSP